MTIADFANSTTRVAAARAERKTARNLLAIAAFVLTFHPPTFVRPVQAAVQPVAVNPADLPRFHQIHTFFWRGAAPSFAGLDTLKQNGVRTVIDLRRSADRVEAERKYCALIGLNYINLPMGDAIPGVGKQREFMRIVDDAAQNPEHGVVFLHCSHGSDRTGFLTGLWRVQRDHWSIAEAASEALGYGFLVHKLEKNPPAKP